MFKLVFRTRDSENSGTAETTFEIDPDRRPSSEMGEPGSLLDMALALGVEIDHACGGVTACSTCHVFIKQGGRSCKAASEAEEDQLDNAPAVSFESRLACQAVPDGTEDIVAEIPAWNRNLVKEGPH
ncbi:MAG: 2Fe-2S iron-sulfur cluster-binding protein [Bacteriovoracia bacterium]